MGRRCELVRQARERMENEAAEVESRLQGLGVQGVCDLADQYRKRLTTRQRAMIRKWSIMRVARLAMTVTVRYGYQATPDYCK